MAVALAQGCCPVDGRTVIGAVGDHAGDRSLHRLQQNRDRGDIAHIKIGQDVRHDFAGLCVDGQMQLAPSPRSATVLLGVPFALAEHRQSGAVHNDLNRPVMLGSPRLAAGERPAAAG
nr:hypothetical protein [Lichenicola cladoniae]